MAATSTGAFAHGNNEPSAGGYRDEGTTPMSADAMTEDASEEVGHGSGEPGEAYTRAEDPRVTEADGIASFNHQKFLNEVWAAP